MSEEKTVEELMSENARLKQAYKYIHASRNSVDRELNESQKENASLRDQLSKEREKSKALEELLNEDLHEENKTLKHQLEKEREMRKELVKELSFAAERLKDFKVKPVFIESLIKRASELDKNKT